MALLSEEKQPLYEEESPQLYGDSINEKQRIVFHEISYKVVEGVFKRNTKVILNSISGMLPPGVNAIMGPTGSGKTSLLDVLAGRKDKKGLRGTVLVNGVVQPKNFRYMSGYVLQDDVVMDTLSVKENLYFSAALRLPNSMSWSEKKQRVKRVIDELGLNGCADTKMGNEFIRGVSGGERKRTSIGMELIIEPDVLFLDEPTTGLDAYTAVATVQLLRQLCDNTNRIIVMSIHQPRYSIYRLFDTLTLLSRGEMVYHGDNKKSLEYFNTLGFVCEEHDNPADFLLDVVNLCERKADASFPKSISAIEQGSINEPKNVNLAAAYRHSDQYRMTMADCNRAMSERRVPKSGSGFFSINNYATNALWQLLIALIRSFINLVRNPMTSVLQYIITVIFGLIVGAIYWQIDTGVNGYQNRVGAIFFIIMNQIFGNLSAIDLFVRQRVLFINENLSGYYRVSVFFIAKVSVDLFCTRFFPLCFFTVITYFMLGFQIDVAKFFIYFLTLFLTSFCAAAIAFWVSAGVKVAGIGSLLVALCFVVQMLFGGFLITLDSLPVYLRWLQYISLFRYSVEALIVNEVDGLTFEQFVGGEYISINGTEILENQGFKVSWLWYDQIGLAGLCVLFLALGYITLRLVKKEK